MAIELPVAAALALGLERFIEFLKQFDFTNAILPSSGTAESKSRSDLGLAKDAEPDKDQAATIKKAKEKSAANARKNIPVIQLILGLALAVGFDIDIFAAATTNGGTDNLLGEAGVWFTGIIMGLGASPTHEAISFFEKKNEEAKSNIG